jgi:hypothetical protein
LLLTDFPQSASFYTAKTHLRHEILSKSLPICLTG